MCNNSYKINMSKLLVYSMIFIILEPQFFSTIKIIDYIFLFLKMLIGLYYSFLVYKNRKNLNVKPIYILFLLFLYIIINSILCGSMSLSKILDFYEGYILGLIIIVENKRKKVNIISILSNVTFIYLFLNFISFLAFPNGLYVTITNSIWEKKHLCWLLGYKNPISRFALVTVCFNLINSISKKEKIIFKAWVVIFIALITVIKMDSATSLVSIFVLIMFTIWGNTFKIPKFINFASIYFFGGVASYLLIVIKIQTRFSNIIEKYLNRSASFTGRTRIWDNTIFAIKNNFILGNGFQNGSATTNIIGATHPHNFYLYLLYSGGIVLLILFTIFIFSISRKTSKYLMNRNIQICLVSIIAMIIICLTESMTQTMSLFISIWLIAYYLCDDYKNKKTERMI